MSPQPRVSEWKYQMARTRAAKSVSLFEVAVWWMMIWVTRRYLGVQVGLLSPSGAPQSLRATSAGLGASEGVPIIIAWGRGGLVVTPALMKEYVRSWKVGVTPGLLDCRVTRACT